jgi:hypothetical protein
MWLRERKEPIEKLNPVGSGMNLWGKKGVYMTQDVNVDARFGPCSIVTQSTIFVVCKLRLLDKEHFLLF